MLLFALFVNWLRTDAARVTDRQTRELVARRFLDEQDCKLITIAEPLSGDELEDFAFHVIGSTETIETIALAQLVPGMGAPEIAHALRKVIQCVPHVKMLMFQLHMSSTETESIMSVLRTIDPARMLELHFTFGNSFDAMARPIAQFLRESTVGLLSIECATDITDQVQHPNQEQDPLVVSKAAMNVLYEAIGQSESITYLYILKNATFAPDPSGTTQKSPPEVLAAAVAKSTVLKCVCFHDPSDHEFAHSFASALHRTQPMVELEMDVSKRLLDTGAILYLLDRQTSRYKLLLADDHVPLNYWPRILFNASVPSKTPPAHKPLDLLFFLVREKSDVLLQNVNKRRIRKPKRFQP